MKKVMTVLGEIVPDQLGIVMPHEHIVCDIARHSGKENNLLNDIELCKRAPSALKCGPYRSPERTTYPAQLPAGKRNSLCL